jgi:CheY-like chemotaxis protein
MNIEIGAGYELSSWLAAGLPPQRPDAPDQAGGGQLSLNGRRILIVEDESLIALLIQDALEEAGADVVGPCYTVPECLKVARSESLDAAVLDVDLAGQDIFPAADVLRQRGIPIVFHTAHGDREELQTRFGEVEVCRKPVPMENLVAVLGRAASAAKNN